MRTSRAVYRLYGVLLQSSLKLPCQSAPPNSRPDVWLKLGDPTRFALARREIGPSSRTWFSCKRLKDGCTYLRWTGLFEFLVSPDGRHIHYHRLEHATRESLAVYLLGQVLSFALLAFGRDPLHGTVVATKGKAVAIVGNCGDGKSTLAAAMLARGCRVVTDDVIALDGETGGWCVQPGVPRLKLFPSVARKLLGYRGGATMNKGTSKLVLPLGPDQSIGRPMPLAAIYVLSDPRAHRPSRALEPVTLERLSGSEAFLEVIRAAFNVMVLRRERLANQFAFAARLAAEVPMRRLTYPRRLTLLPTVCDTLLADLSTLARTQSSVTDA